jgi:hypothetical protein
MPANETSDKTSYQTNESSSITQYFTEFRMRLLVCQSVNYFQKQPGYSVKNFGKEDIKKK